MIIRSRAPLRISFSGGGTDVSPYPEEKGGVVLSTTIDKYSYASLIPKQEPVIQVKSIYFEVVQIRCRSSLVYDGELTVKGANTLEAGRRVCTVYPQRCSRQRLIIFTTQSPYRHHPPMLQNPGPYDIAQLLPRGARVLGIKGGKQDQYAAAFGGLILSNFYRDYTAVNLPRSRPSSSMNWSIICCSAIPARPVCLPALSKHR